MNWPNDIKDLIFFPRPGERWEELAELAEPQDWDYDATESEYSKPILSNYVRYTDKRLAEEDKIIVADDGSAIVFNTGLVTTSQESIFCYCTTNRFPDRSQPWYFHAWRRRGEHDLTRFSALPEMAHYFDDPAQPAIPQYYRGRVQLLLPLRLTRSDVADLAIVGDNSAARLDLAIASSRTALLHGRPTTPST